MGTKSFIGGVTVGAGMVYLLDPERGRLRRERLGDRLESVVDLAKWSLETGASGTSATSPGRYGSRSGDIKGLEAATLRSPNRSAASGGMGYTALQIAGGLLAIYGLTRRGTSATLLRTLGTGLLVGTTGKLKLGLSGSGPLDRRRAVDIQKTLFIAAPVEEVYSFWTNYENFPLFMSHVRDVEDLGGGRSHWSVSGPGGVAIEWSAVMTQQVRDEVIAWRSEAGSMLENAGIIRFEPSGNGTRVNLRFCYHPPAGGAGQAVAELLGSDPRAKLNEDLGRMKALLEGTTKREDETTPK